MKKEPESFSTQALFVLKEFIVNKLTVKSHLM